VVPPWWILVQDLAPCPPAGTAIGHLIRFQTSGCQDNLFALITDLPCWVSKSKTERIPSRKIVSDEVDKSNCHFIIVANHNDKI